MSDRGRSAVYAAETVLRGMLDTGANQVPVCIAGSTVTLPIERRFGDIPSVQTYVDRVLGSGWVAARWPDAARPVRVRERQQDAQAHYESWAATIAVHPGSGRPGWAMREVVVLHEIAHHLNPAGDSHGRGFIDTMIELVDGVIGPEAGWVLRVLMHDTGALPAPAR